ncbi:MAG: Arginine--tRNA ligase [Verrucomicrobia subdivision 3 bacterium]|nr:Arginine--tRNA ligase [Limisphaerales bacterium]MCS1414560.1 Arginine--tRNA ligase [Limisphaerales bacterium]
MLFKRIEESLRNALEEVHPELKGSELLVRKCPVVKFGDYQCNSIMAVTKRRGGDARRVASDVAERMSKDKSLCESIEAVGPGFINFRIRIDALESCLNQNRSSSQCFVEREPEPRTIVVDFSSPNVAKPMHVGHIRSTNLGNCIARILRFIGHRVVTDNHIGDWGTQFGKLIAGWKTDLNEAALDRDALGEMERLYRKMNQVCESDRDALDRARSELLKLQKGDEANREIWQRMIDLSRLQFDELYSRLDVRFDETLGESFYNDRLNSLVQEIEAEGLAERSQGALLVFFPDDAELKNHPAIIQKSDGAANYATTDLATLEYRSKRWQPSEIIYVTDGRQQLHFKQLFRIYRRWKPNDKVRLNHTWFGSIMGKDGKPFKTRSGDVIKLADLLDEAEQRARKIVEEKNAALEEEQKKAITKIVGIGAIKYADLLPNRQSDYVFDWDSMLSLKGNTAPYLQYAYTRTRGIFRKFDGDIEVLRQENEIRLAEPEEVGLAKHLVNFPLVLQLVIEEYRPNYLCAYLYELAGLLARFYENCPILKAEAPVRASRLLLVEQAGTMIREGLGLLGIQVTDVM